ncbi:MAG: CaiB/BaiF CoA-transferase family protein [Myxococcales bacterium]
MKEPAAGPLSGVRVVEFAGIGPGPFCGMMLADMGADVLRVDRPASKRQGAIDTGRDLANRGKRSIVLDLKTPAGTAAALQLCAAADLLVEGFRPGVLERLGLGPERCWEHNPRLVYGRVTGFGQDGPLANAAGHDINFIALSGALHAIGPAARPAIPLNLIGDYGGGGMMLAFGLVCGLLEARRSGRGQVIDAAMIDGVSALLTPIFGMKQMGLWTDQREQNLIDGGSFFYGVYETGDGQWISIGPIEPQFYAELLGLLDLDPAEFSPQFDVSRWPAWKERLAAVFRTRTRAEWCAKLEGTEACFAPVLSLEEAPEHPQQRARNGFLEVGGVRQPAPAPRFSRTPGTVRSPPPAPGEGAAAALSDWGFSAEEIARLAPDAKS